VKFRGGVGDSVAFGDCDCGGETFGGSGGRIRIRVVVVLMEMDMVLVFTSP